MFRRKQSLWKTRREMRTLDGPARAAVMRWWSLAEEWIHPGPRDLSEPSAFVALVLALGEWDGEHRTGRGASGIAIRAGYALRAELPQLFSRVDTLDASDLDEQSFVAAAAFPTGHDGLIIEERHPEAAALLSSAADFVYNFALDRFNEIVSVGDDYWDAVVALATYQVHQNAGKALTEPEIDLFLRYGFILRAIDEALSVAGATAPPEQQSEDAKSHRGTELQRAAAGTALDVNAWLLDSAGVANLEFEPFAEFMLDIGVIEILGFHRVVDRIMSRRPYTGYDPAIEAGVANARLGYALRNRELQLIEVEAATGEADPLLSLAAERAGNSGANTAVIHRLIRDAVTHGDRQLLYDATPGTTGQVRREAFDTWAFEHFAGDDPLTGARATAALLEHGYFMHRLFELCPDRLERWAP